MTRPAPQTLRLLVPAVVAAPLALWAACSGGEESEGLPPLLQMRSSGELVFGHPQADCAECHEQHVKEWEFGPHAYATKDPVFHAMVRLGQQQSNGKLGQFCVQCHAPIALANNSAPVYVEDGVAKQDTESLDRLAATGVSCDVCHSITDVLEPVNARAILTPNGVRRGTIQDPVETPAHASAYSPLHESSDLCGMCHAVNNPRGAPLEETFPEWENSSFAERGETCQSCHMPAYEGVAAKGGPTRTVHRHTFVGVDVSLLPPDEFPGYQELRDLSEQLLQESAELDVRWEGETNRIRIEVTNLAGHALPSGATAEREMWMEVLVRNPEGEVVFETGTFDAQGSLRDHLAKHTLEPGTDPQLIVWKQQMIDDPTRVDPNSTAEIRPVTFPWQASWIQNHLIPADGSDVEYLDLSELPPGDYTASARLRFRTFPIYFLLELEEKAGLDPAVKDRMPIVDMETAELSFTIGG